MKRQGTPARSITVACMAAALLVVAIATACMAATAAGKGRPVGDTLRIGMAQYPATLHPLFDAMLAKSLVLGATLRPVTAYGPDWKPACLLCTELPSLANGRAATVRLHDGSTGIAARYTLADNLFWGDGVAVTTDDILLAYDVGRNPLAGVNNHSFYADDIASIKKIDARTFIITFTKQACDFASIDDITPLPAHLERSVFEADPATYQNRTLYVTAPATPGLWMGPYRVEKIAAGSALTLARNPFWRGTIPAFAQVELRAIENTGAMASALLAGQIDYIAGELGLPLDQALGLEKRLPEGAFRVVYKPGLTYEHIDLPYDTPPFNDARVRQALLLAIDRQAISDKIYDGRQPVADANISPLDAVYAPSTAVYLHDPARAAALLDAAGWRLGADGLRRNAQGEALRITLATTAGNLSREVVQQVIQADWRKAGIDTVIRNQPPRVLFGETLRKRLFDGGVMYAWMASPRNIPKTTLHSSMIPTADNGYAGQNNVGYANPKMDKIIDDLSIVCAPKRNQALWTQLQEIYARDLPALPLFFRAEAYFMPTWLEGITPTGHLHPSTLWIENWHVTTDKEHP